jgi:hypothetical protein
MNKFFAYVNLPKMIGGNIGKASSFAAKQAVTIILARTVTPTM